MDTVIDQQHNPNEHFNVINESGVYCLTFTSKKLEAKKFKRWVTSAVLPSIRKTGSYSGELDENDLMIQQAKQLVSLLEHKKITEQRLKNLEADSDIKDAKIENISSKLREFDSETGYRTITAYTRGLNITLPISELNRLGRQASKRCREYGYKIGKVADERFGTVNSYPIDILNAIFAE